MQPHAAPPVVAGGTGGRTAHPWLGCPARAVRHASTCAASHTPRAVGASTGARSWERRSHRPGASARLLMGSAMTQRNAYETAKAGGRHGAFYRLYMQRRAEEIRRGIRSLDQRIQEHREKMRDPVHNVAGYAPLDPRQQRALLESKWPADIQRLQEQRDILEGIVRERGS